MATSLNSTRRMEGDRSLPFRFTSYGLDLSSIMCFDSRSSSESCVILLLATVYKMGISVSFSNYLKF
jgi:hypothetical protein